MREIKPAHFAYYRAETVDQAVRLLADHQEAKVIAGGQSLVPLMNFRLSRPTALVDINWIQSLTTIEETGDAIRIGSLVRHQELVDSALLRQEIPVLSYAAEHIGHWAIRNRGTIGGSIAHADPAAELPAAMVALNAQLFIQGPRGSRMVPAREFFLGFMTTALEADEILTGVTIAGQTRSMGFAEVVRRPGDFALAGAFVETHSAGGVVTWFGIGPNPILREWSHTPTDPEGRMRLFSDLVSDVLMVEDPQYRMPLAAEVAERAYVRAQGGHR